MPGTLEATLGAYLSDRQAKGGAHEHKGWVVPPARTKLTYAYWGGNVGMHATWDLFNASHAKCEHLVFSMLFHHDDPGLRVWDGTWWTCASIRLAVENLRR
jgi:hypothetical protein